MDQILHACRNSSDFEVIIGETDPYVDVFQPCIFVFLNTAWVTYEPMTYGVRVLNIRSMYKICI